MLEELKLSSLLLLGSLELGSLFGGVELELGSELEGVGGASEPDEEPLVPDELSLSPPPPSSEESGSFRHCFITSILLHDASHGITFIDGTNPDAKLKLSSVCV